MSIFIYYSKPYAAMKKIFLTMLVFLAIIQLVTAAQIPIINSYVTDNAGVLSPGARAQLENDLRDLEKSTNGVQYVIYIENEYPKEYSLEEYTLKIAETNKIGKKANDNGILLYIAVKDKKYRWEVGYGVEGTLNSALLGGISREYFVPNFRAGNYEQGILQAFDVTKRILLGSNDADIVKLKNSSSTDLGNNKIYIYLLVFAFFIILNIFIRIRNYKKNPKGKHKDDFYHGAAWGLFAGGFGRGGFGGGGSGGFSGGGGGFGGGGSSGGF